MNLEHLHTEKRNPNTMDIDTVSSLEICRMMNREDLTVADAVTGVLPDIARLINTGAASLRKKGRIFYAGSGSSGRLGVMDASEIPPTFSIEHGQFNGIIAGGDEALRDAAPLFEDDELAGRKALIPHRIAEHDLVIGLTASGRTPFVRGALLYAQKQGAATALICCNKGAELSPLADIAVEIDTGPEAITGSTRLKAGTAQKMVLNMFSTGTMIRMGKVYSNLMVSLNPTNEKLVARAVRIIQEATGVPLPEAEKAFEKTADPQTAIVHLLTGATPEEAKQALRAHEGNIRKAVNQLIK
ncbi:N-acetylmuramic acid 6-phosphate etherase [Alteribacter natronophilus]|uniref:N-acetylmuramic acid 6-phosphate etherase n=1 Tax=Alteribacter natronophilus TaxID=2583810 RepID=UPI00110DB5C6|nr:N-acetylmuramic acid 6-phosphate etherase [Alteribacter natronophilus]TMW71233.1 N-acetylmuramic acid 6-phosphate etherase [Alteribacter natronophilus]